MRHTLKIVGGKIYADGTEYPTFHDALISILKK